MAIKQLFGVQPMYGEPTAFGSLVVPAGTIKAKTFENEIKVTPKSIIGRYTFLSILL